MSQPLRWALGYSATAPALLYLLHPCSRMPSADFCLITCQVTLTYAIGFHLVRSFGLMTSKSQGTCRSEPYWLVTDRLLSKSPPLFIGREGTCTFFAQLHYLRWPLDHLASSSCANSPPAYASYNVLVHQLANLLAASSGPVLAEKPLPFTSS
jgi:hypothetical protein